MQQGTMDFQKQKHRRRTVLERMFCFMSAGEWWGHKALHRAVVGDAYPGEHQPSIVSVARIMRQFREEAVKAQYGIKALERQPSEYIPGLNLYRLVMEESQWPNTGDGHATDASKR